MTVLRLSAALTTVLALGSACAGSKPNAGDTSVTARPDSSTASPAASPAPTPPPPAVANSANKSASPRPSGSPSATTAQPTPTPTPTPSETVLTGTVSVGGL